MANCRFPQHHDGGGSSAPWGWVLAVIVVVALAGSATAARVASDALTVLAWVIGVVVVTAALAGVALIVRHNRRGLTVSLPPRVIVHAPPARPVQAPAAPREAISGPVPGIDPAALGQAVNAELDLAHRRAVVAEAALTALDSARRRADAAEAALAALTARNPSPASPSRAVAWPDERGAR